MKNILLPFLTVVLLIISAPSFATHNRAGEITYEFIGTNTIRATITTYTKQSSYQADRDSLPIHWGDGSPDNVLVRSNGPIGPGGVPSGDTLGSDMKKNIYTGTHSYTGSDSFYVISMTDANRNSDIINISNSVNVQFYLEDTIWFRGQGLNHSPTLLYPPIDFANVGDTFFHNPTAYDVEADSLVFELITPLQSVGSVVPGYISPQQVITYPGDTLTIDRLTGMITWAVPRQTGIYNIAIRISEYRYGILLGTMMRDMQVIVFLNSLRRAPIAGSFTDTVLIPGQNFQWNCSAPDPIASRINTLTATGGPFTLAAGMASFSSTSGNQPQAQMSWIPGPNRYKTRETSIITITCRTDNIQAPVTQRSFRITVLDSTQTAIHDPSLSHAFVKVSPVPSRDVLHVSSSEIISQVEIFSADGRLVKSSAGTGQAALDMDTRGLSTGIYTLIARDKNGNPAADRVEIIR